MDLRWDLSLCLDLADHRALEVIEDDRGGKMQIGSLSEPWWHSPWACLGECCYTGARQLEVRRQGDRRYWDCFGNDILSEAHLIYLAQQYERLMNDAVVEC